MKTFKKIFSLLLVLTLAITSVHITNIQNIKAATAVAEWQASGIIAPVSGKLIGAGYIDIIWDNQSIDATKYDVYVDGVKATTLTASSEATMKYEMYTVKVSAHTAKIVAYLADGTQATANSTFYVTKKGICVNTADMGTVVDPADLNLGWYYSWGTQSFKETEFSNTKFYDLEFVPMIWGDGKETIEKIMNRANEQGYKYLLGYNEPDLKQESNISPSTAVLRWNQFMKYKGELRLGSPSISTSRAPSESPEWWDPYWNGLSVQAKADTTFIAFHRYYEYYSGPETAQDFLRLIDETYYKFGKPIWVTEFALWKFNKDKPEDARKAQEFMRIVINGLEERDYVERYSWFSPSYDSGDATASALFDYDTGKISEIGKIYADIGNPAGYNAKTYGTDTSTTVDTSTAACIKAMKPTDLVTSAKKKAFTYDIYEKDSYGYAGFEIQYSTKKKFTKKTTKTINKSTAKGKIKIKLTKKQKKQLKKKKKKQGKKTIKVKYFVRARAYKIVGGVKYYLEWSSTEIEKIKF